MDVTADSRSFRTALTSVPVLPASVWRQRTAAALGREYAGQQVEQTVQINGATLDEE